MRFRTLGRTGLDISEISLGTVELGMDYGIGATHRPAEQDAVGLLNRALDLGVNFIDTAHAYGESEAIIGRALRHRRDEFALCSKVGPFPEEPLDIAALRAHMQQSLEQSLRELQTDRLDVLMLHSAPAELIERGEAASVLESLRATGKIRWTGASVYGKEAALCAISSGQFDVIQIAYSLLDQDPKATIFAEAERNGAGIIARSVLLKGALTHRYRDLPPAMDVLKRAVQELEMLAAGLAEGLPELAYRYVLSTTPPHTALVGASSVEELEAAVRFGERGDLPYTMITGIGRVRMPEERWLNPGCWPPV